MHKKTSLLITQSVVAAGLLVPAACSSDEELTTPPPDPLAPVEIAVPDGGFTTPRCRVLSVTPTLRDSSYTSFRWLEGDSLLSTAAVLDFIALEPGTHALTLRAATADSLTFDVPFSVTVTRETTAYSPYVTAVTDYRPAPGQYVNTLPEYAVGDTQADMNAKALEAIGANARGLITLGAFGGYVVCGFDHTIVNVPGQHDFKVLGNAFYSGTGQDGEQSGSCEPGIVMVAYDRNGNGRPDDDEWYELAGSEYGNAGSFKNYSITYTRPADDHQPTTPPADEQSWNTDAAYIAWSDDLGQTGYLCRNKYHAQSYYPEWLDEPELTFTGTRLPDNGNDLSGNGTYWSLRAYAWGYADNAPNASDASNFDIDWAVDRKGRPVHLPGIDFVKIYTGVSQQCGWLGETSTEMAGIDDLHLLNP